MWSKVVVSSCCPQRLPQLILFTILDFSVQPFIPFLILTEGKEDVFELSVHHHAVLGFVVELKHLHEVLVGAGVLVLLDLSENGHEVINLDHLLLLLVLASDLLNDSQGGVQVQGSEAVADVEGVHRAIALEVID